MSGHEDQPWATLPGAVPEDKDAEEEDKGLSCKSAVAELGLSEAQTSLAAKLGLREADLAAAELGLSEAARKQTAVPSAKAAKNKPCSRAPPAAWEEHETEANQFVREMRRQGCRNWVVYRGGVVNLADPSDTDRLDAGIVAQLMEQAENAALERLVPLQPWEAEKLQSVATQVVNALDSGRYCKDFGEMLMTHLKGWAGVEDWAQAETRQVSSLINADDPKSRDELRRWLEISLCSSLREVQKVVNNGQLAGFPVQMEPSTARSSSGNALANGILHDDPQKDVDQEKSESQCLHQECSDTGTRMDPKEEAELQEALQASLEEQEDRDAECTYACGVSSELEQEQHEYIRIEPGCWSDCEDDMVLVPQVSDCQAEESAATAVATAETCDHGCNLSSGCCQCVTRAPKPGLVPSLCWWWQERGFSPMPIVTSRWRFFCSHCAAKPIHSMTNTTDKELPLPFGGKLVCTEDFTTAKEVVEPSYEAAPADGDSAFEGLSSISGSWISVRQPGLRRTPSEGSWVLPDVDG